MNYASITSEKVLQTFKDFLLQIFHQQHRKNFHHVAQLSHDFAPAFSLAPGQVGQKVFAIGNPFGLDQTLTNGIISHSAALAFVASKLESEDPLIFFKHL